MSLDSEYSRDAIWGPMSHPATETIPAGSPPWKDHIYLAFWDARSQVHGFFHWNSSPNHPTHKAQIVVSFKGKTLDVIEPLPANAQRFLSQSMDYDLQSKLLIDNERISGTLTLAPRFRPIDYTPGGTIPPLVAGKPLNHHQQGLRLKGQLKLDGEMCSIDALGFRTRTWGFRDDSMQFLEYFSLFACFEDFDISAMKFRWPDGRQLADGGIVTATAGVQARDLHIRRDRAGSPMRLAVDLADGRSIELKRRQRETDFWCPIGLPERDGPTFCAHDEVVEWEMADGKTGHGLSEQAFIRFVC